MPLQKTDIPPIASAIAATMWSILNSGGASSSSSSSGSRARQGRKAQSKRALPISSGKGGMNPTNASDLRVRPPTNRNVPTTIPRNIQSIIVWDSVKIESQIAASATSIIEQNFIFTITLHPQYASYLAIYDQYSIPMVSIEFDSQCPPGSGFAPPALHTALDFDNATALGSVQSLEDFATAEYMVMQPGSRHLRSIRPSCKGVTSTTGGTATSSVAGPLWIDSAVNNVPFYGIRSILNTGSPTVSVLVTQTIWFCFRNQI